MANNVKIRGLIYDMTHFTFTFGDPLNNFEPRSINSLNWNFGRTATVITDSRGVPYGKVVGDMSYTLDPIDMSQEDVKYITSKFADMDVMSHPDTGEFTLNVTAQKGEQSFSWEFRKCLITNHSMGTSKNSEARGSITIMCEDIIENHDA